MAGRVNNPDWIYEEAILVVDLYFRLESTRITARHPQVLELSRILNRLPYHPMRNDPERFRNPNGVYMTLMNIKRLDTGNGLRLPSRVVAEVFARYRDDRETLHRIAQVIRNKVDSSLDSDASRQDDSLHL